MTQETFNKRLKFIAEWWDPSVAKLSVTHSNSPGCIVEIALGRTQLRWDLALHKFGLYCPTSVWMEWDKGDRAAALEAIAQL